MTQREKEGCKHDKGCLHTHCEAYARRVLGVVKKGLETGAGPVPRKKIIRGLTSLGNISNEVAESLHRTTAHSCAASDEMFEIIAEHRTPLAVHLLRIIMEADGYRDDHASCREMISSLVAKTLVPKISATELEQGMTAEEFRDTTLTAINTYGAFSQKSGDCITRRRKEYDRYALEEFLIHSIEEAMINAAGRPRSTAPTHYHSAEFLRQLRDKALPKDFLTHIKSSALQELTNVRSSHKDHSTFSAKEFFRSQRAFRSIGSTLKPIAEYFVVRNDEVTGSKVLDLRKNFPEKCALIVASTNTAVQNSSYEETLDQSKSFTHEHLIRLMAQMFASVFKTQVRTSHPMSPMAIFLDRLEKEHTKITGKPFL